ncbi:MliC family protein [Devosia sp. SL43]|nr:MliC family protein [Devosia sp. SL43]
MLATGTAHAVDATLQLDLTGQGRDFERRSVLYDCSEGEPFDVVYINAAPNFLALVPIVDEPERLVFASVVSASGVRYVAGHWVWWTQGIDASLYDVTLGDDADPVLTCSEFIQTP